MGGIKISIGLSHKRFLKDLKLVTRRLRGMAKSIGRIGLRMGRSLARGLMRGAAAGVAGLAGVIGKSLSESGKFERFEFQFRALLGNVKDAKSRIDEMKELDLEVDAELGDLIDASRILTVFTNNMYAGTDAMRVMADAAAVTPNNIKDIAFWYGRAYSMIQSGRPFGEAAMRLQEMGLLSGEARNEIERLSVGAGRMKNIPEIMATLNAEFQKFEGAAKRNAETWVGLMSILRSATSQAFAAMGDAIMPLAKFWVKELTDKLTKLRKDGTLAAWGLEIRDALIQAKKVIMGEFVPALSELSKEIKKSIAEGGLSKSLEDGIESGISKGMDKALAFFRKNVPVFASIGLEIGEAMMKGMNKSIKKTKVGQFFNLWFGKEGREFMMTGKVLSEGERRAKNQKNADLKNTMDQNARTIGHLATTYGWQDLPDHKPALNAMGQAMSSKPPLPVHMKGSDVDVAYQKKDT